MTPDPPERQTVRIRCRLDGPLVVELEPPAARPQEDAAPAGHGQPGGAETAAFRLLVTDHEGNPFPLPTHKRAVALCRCGHSRSRPFCDGSHKTAGFVAADLAREAGGRADPPGPAAGPEGPPQAG